MDGIHFYGLFVINNIEIVHLLIEYANQHQIILELYVKKKKKILESVHLFWAIWRK